MASFDCPLCRGLVPVWEPDFSESAVCPSCGASIDLESEKPRAISKPPKPFTAKPLLPIGSQGTLRGKTWAVRGFIQASDQTGGYSWEEYYLRGEGDSTSWLVQENGHWAHLRPLPRSARKDSGKETATAEGKSFRIFDLGKARAVRAAGEFDWRFDYSEWTNETEYIDPPLVLSHESDSSGSEWLQGEYVDREEVRRGFPSASALPPVMGIAPSQPSPWRAALPALWGWTGIFSAVIVAIQILTHATSRDEWIFAERFTFASTPEENTHTLGPFEFRGGLSNVRLDFEAPVDNSWLALDVSLFDEAAGKEYAFDMGVEYYSGYEGGEYWSEGGRNAHTFLPSIPDGTYKISATAVGEPGMVSRSYSVSLRRDVPDWTNLLWALGALLLGPVFVHWRDHAFEVARWSDSDFSPYDDDDEE
ncbi:MAG: DUF4178 domain-containing protein [Bdellovibrionota bacterium]